MKRILTVLFALILSIGIISINNRELSAEEDADPSTNYLCITAEEDGVQVKFTKNGQIDGNPVLLYSTDKTNWNSYSFNSYVPSTPLNKNEKIYFKAGKLDGSVTANPTFSEGYNARYIDFHSNGEKKVSLSGNIMSLLKQDCSQTSVPEYAFAQLFSGCDYIVSIDKLLLPATTLNDYCYTNMFQNCTGIKSIPAKLLPAMTLADYCYCNMFAGCTGITSIPTGLLPANNLDYACYAGMFKECTGLVSVPKNLLPATTTSGSSTADTGCYYQMFYGCEKLQNLPDLPATGTLGPYCYYEMFKGCTKIKLSTTKTTNDSDNSMRYEIPFRIPKSGTATEGTDSLTGMFENTGGPFTGPIVIGTTYYAYNWNPTPSPEPQPKDESCEKVIGPTWHWNEAKGVCEELAIVNTFTR